MEPARLSPESLLASTSLVDTLVPTLTHHAIRRLCCPQVLRLIFKLSGSIRRKTPAGVLQIADPALEARLQDNPTPDRRNKSNRFDRYKFEAAIRETKLRGPAKCTAFVLASRADNNTGECFPGLKILGQGYWPRPAHRGSGIGPTARGGICCKPIEGKQERRPGNQRAALDDPDRPRE